MTADALHCDTTLIYLRPAVREDAERLVPIYIDSWNRGFGHLLGMRDITPDLVDRWRTDLADGPVQWTLAEVDAAVVGFVGVGPFAGPDRPRSGPVILIGATIELYRGRPGPFVLIDALGSVAEITAALVLPRRR